MTMKVVCINKTEMFVRKRTSFVITGRERLVVDAKDVKRTKKSQLDRKKCPKEGHTMTTLKKKVDE